MNLKPINVQSLIIHFTLNPLWVFSFLRRVASKDQRHGPCQMMVSTQIANDPKALKAYLKDQYYPSPKIKKCTHIHMHANCTEKLEEVVERNKEKQVEKEAQLRVFIEPDRPLLFLFYDRVRCF